MKPKSAKGQTVLQLYPISVLVRQRVSTRRISIELQAKLLNKHQQTILAEDFSRSAKRQEDYTLSTPEGAWFAQLQGKTITGRYIWDLYFSPKSIVERLVS
jgi:hypothetical protein